MSKNTEKHKILACISHYIRSSYTVRLNHAKKQKILHEYTRMCYKAFYIGFLYKIFEIMYDIII